MTVGPSVGDAISNQPTSQQSATPVARGGYDPNPPTHYDVNGEQVSVDELRSGYLRQQDYTRKTQDLASARAQNQAAMELVQALQTDPIGTLREMASVMGVDASSLASNSAVGEQFGQPDDGTFADDLDPNDPQAAELNQLRQMVEDLRAGQEAAEMQRAETWLDGEMTRVEQIAAQMGLDFDPETVYEFMVQSNIDDPMQAFRAMTWDQVAQGAQAPMPDIAGLKRTAALQAQRSGPAAPRVHPEDLPQPTSIGEALQQVMAEQGIRDFSQVSYDDTNMIYGG